MRELSAAERGERLADFYRRVHREAMRDAPICNEALEVEAIGFRDFGAFCLGVVVTPWFANLVVAPGEGETAPTRLRFPAGDVEFTASVIEGFGPLAACSLFSPMGDFADHRAAREAARAALEALFDSHLGAAAPPPAAGLDRRALLGARRGREAAS